MPIKEKQLPDRDYFMQLSDRVNKNENRVNIMEIKIDNTDRQLQSYIDDSKEYRKQLHKTNEAQNIILREIQDGIMMINGAKIGIGRMSAMFVGAVTFACAIITLVLKIKGS